MAPIKEPSVYRKMWRLLSARERRYALLLFGMMIVGMGLETLGIGAVVPAILLITQDDLGAKYPAAQPLLEALGNPDHRTLIVGGMLALVGIYLVKGLFLGLLAWVQTRFTVRIKVRMSQHLFSTYVYQPYTFHLQRNSSQLIRNAFTEVNQLVQGGVGAAMTLCTELLLVVGVAALLLLVEPLGALAVATVLGLSTGIFHLATGGHVSQWGRKRRHHERQRLQHMQQGLGGVKEMKLLGREKEFLELFRLHTERVAAVSENALLLRKLPRLWLELLTVSGLAILVLAMLWRGSEMAAIGPTLALFGAAAFRLLPSVNKASTAVQSLRFTRPVIDNLYEELQLEAPARMERAKSAPLRFRTEVRLAGVTYTYPTGHSCALSDVSFSIRRGQSVGFFGPSGSGKSTLIDIILGMLAPDSGSVTVDGKDIRDDLRAWQDQIGYVPQSIYLTDDSLRRNIAFGVPERDMNDEAMERAVKAAQLDEFAASLPEGLETVVGERGVRLSGGQRQRIGIARALYHDPAVLVLDEATSALDTATEREVMRAVTALQGEKTILIVAHRMSTVENCGWLFRLEAGRIVAQGSPKDVLAPSFEPELSAGASAAAQHG